MKKEINKDVKAILVCLTATILGVISIFTTDTSIMRAFYGVLSLIFFIGTMISVGKYIENKKISQIDNNIGENKEPYIDDNFEI